ncbi:MAG: hypothetical protein ACI86S_000442 [Paracoccaceae bacterium]|jgi:hypothetical protein
MMMCQCLWAGIGFPRKIRHGALPRTPGYLEQYEGGLMR